MKKVIITFIFSFILFCTYSQEIEEVVFQPGVEIGFDAQVYNDIRLKNRNFAKSTTLVACGWTNYAHGSPECDSRIYIKFLELERLTNHEIVDAKLTLFCDRDYKYNKAGEHKDNSACIGKINEDWQEGELNWNNQPAFDLSKAVIIPANINFDSLVIDVTELTKEMIGSNYGYIIKQIEEVPYRSMAFCSSDNSNSRRRPKLTVEYKRTKRETPFKDTELKISKETVKVKSEKINIKLWDNNKEDGDIISIFLNDQNNCIISGYKLKKEPAEFNINLKRKDNIIILHADNLGRMPPNTASMIIDDGFSKQTLILNADENTSEGIRIIIIE